MNPTAILAASLLVVGAAAGQSSSGAPQGGQPASVLGGPTVRETVSERTLAKRDMQGRVRRLDLSPEESALELLNLDRESQAKADAVVADYHRRLDTIVGDNIELLLRFQTAKEGPERLGVLREAMELFKPLRDGGRLRDRIAAVLPEEHAKRFEALIDGYWKAILDEVQADAKARKDKAGPEEIEARERLRAVGDEIRRSYERQVVAKSRQLEDLLKPLNLSPEQDGKVRTLVTEFAEQTKGKANPAQRRELFGKLLKELNPEQKRQLLRQVLVGTPPADTPAKPGGEPPMQGTEGSTPPAEPMKDAADPAKK